MRISYPPLIEMTNIYTDAGFDIVPITEEAGVRVMIFQDDLFKKEGQTVYDDWDACELATTKMLYELIIKK